jgi:hypothetical protein
MLSLEVLEQMPSNIFYKAKTDENYTYKFGITNGWI